MTPPHSRSLLGQGVAGGIANDAGADHCAPEWKEVVVLNSRCGGPPATADAAQRRSGRTRQTGWRRPRLHATPDALVTFREVLYVRTAHRTPPQAGADTGYHLSLGSTAHVCAPPARWMPRLSTERWRAGVLP